MHELFFFFNEAACYLPGVSKESVDFLIESIFWTKVRLARADLCELLRNPLGAGNGPCAGTMSLRFGFCSSAVHSLVI